MNEDGGNETVVSIFLEESLLAKNERQESCANFKPWIATTMVFEQISAVFDLKASLWG